MLHVCAQINTFPDVYHVLGLLRTFNIKKYWSVLLKSACVTLQVLTKNDNLGPDIRSDCVVYWIEILST